MRKSLIETATGNVVNVIELAEGADWLPLAGRSLGADGGEIGQKWNGSAYEWLDPPAKE